jgi:hypothetical protein
MAWMKLAGAGLSAALLLAAAPSAVSQQAETPAGPQSHAIPERDGAPTGQRGDRDGRSDRAPDRRSGGDNREWNEDRSGRYTEDDFRRRDRDRDDDEDEDERESWRGYRYGDGPRHGGGMMMHRGLRALCRPGGGRMLEMMLSRLERLTNPTEAQRPALERLKDAGARAREVALAGCPSEPAMTPVGRLAAAEKRLAAMLEAIRLVRPPLEEFFAQLSEEQKARLYALTARPWMGGYGPPRMRDDWREWRERRRERWRDEERGYGRDDRGATRDRGYRRDDDEDRPRRPIPRDRNAPSQL